MITGKYRKTQFLEKSSTHKISPLRQLGTTYQYKVKFKKKSRTLKQNMNTIKLVLNYTLQ